MTATHTVNCKGEMVTVETVTMADLAVGDVLVTHFQKANTTSMRYRHPAYLGDTFTVESIRVSKKQTSARVRRSDGSVFAETHLHTGKVDRLPRD